MKTLLSFSALFIYSLIFSQFPGGVSGLDLWYKTGSTVVLSKDFGPNIYPITRSNGSQSLFNFNHSVRFNTPGNLNFPYSVEDLNVATIFTVYINEGNENSSLIHSDWRAGGYQGNGENEKGFYFSTNKLTKESFSLAYPEEEQDIANALVNTLNWFDSNSNKINNSVGTGGESTVFIGKSTSNPSMTAFKGLIPEFIIYRKALSKEERQKVESYLAIKYGITLTSDVSYVNSASDVIWDKEYNTVFGNRILAIGRDDGSALYQKQSKSSHSLNDEIILNAGELVVNNGVNEAEIINNDFIFIGDNDGETTLIDEDDTEGIADWGFYRMERTWLVHPSGKTSDTITTELRYNASELIDRIQNEYEPEHWDDITVWLLIDRSADEQTVSTFNLNQCEAHMYDAVDGDHVVYSNLNWDANKSGFDQFTFAVGPKMLVDVSLQEMECEDTVGDINVLITFGEPNFDFEIFNQNNPNVAVATQTNWTTRNKTFTNLPLGFYTLKITDDTGYERSVDFEVSPTAGMYINLEDEYLLTPNLSLDASEDVYIENVTYQWYRNGDAFDNNPVLEITKPGIYRVVLTNENGCQVEDTTYVVDENGGLEKGSQKEVLDDSLTKETIIIYPNPTQINRSFTVEINLLEKQDAQIQIYDFAGSLIHNETLKNASKYQWNHRILQSGSYLITIITKNQKLTKKLIVK